MTLELESTQKQSPVETGRKCIECGAPTKNASPSRPAGYRHCIACKNFKQQHGFYLTHADREKLGEPKCCICGTTEGRMCIDHDHATNQVRGWLCDAHNLAIGKFNDNIEHLEQAIIYLKQNALQQEKED